MRHLMLLMTCVLAALSCQEKESDTYEGTYAQDLKPEDPSLAKLSDKVTVNYPDSWVSLTFFKDSEGRAQAFLLYKGDIDIRVAWLGVDENLDSNGEEPYPVADLVVDLGQQTAQGRIEVPKYPDLKFTGVFTRNFESLKVEANLLGEIVLLKVHDPEPTTTIPVTYPPAAPSLTGDTGSDPLTSSGDSGDSADSGDTGWGVITL